MYLYFSFHSAPSSFSNFICHIQPFLELINREYEESFVASIFVIKFKDGEEKITLRIPREEILEQCYDIITDVDPCEVIATYKYLAMYLLGDI